MRKNILATKSIQYHFVNLYCYRPCGRFDFGEKAAVLRPLGTILIDLDALIAYCVIFLSLFAFIADGTLGVKRFWKGMFSTVITAFGTQSSIATLSVNLAGAEKKCNVLRSKSTNRIYWTLSR
ncbi:MAG: dicarboxylate/amino acid:cation symporter [Clostridiaceae bacterium]|nr:dicarboxylate/amino acid:cation symporter [Clostridiaceae bacterium]